MIRTFILYNYIRKVTDFKTFPNVAAIAKELKVENLTETHIAIASDLPLTWTSGQKAAFRAYLMKNTEVEFNCKKYEQAGGGGAVNLRVTLVCAVYGNMTGKVRYERLFSIFLSEWQTL